MSNHNFYCYHKQTLKRQLRGHTCPFDLKIEVHNDDKHKSVHNIRLHVKFAAYLKKIGSRYEKKIYGHISRIPLNWQGQLPEPVIIA